MSLRLVNDDPVPASDEQFRAWMVTFGGIAGVSTLFAASVEGGDARLVIRGRTLFGASKTFSIATKDIAGVAVRGSRVVIRRQAMRGPGGSLVVWMKSSEHAMRFGLSLPNAWMVRSSQSSIAAAEASGGPWLTYALMAACIVAYVLVAVTSGDYIGFRSGALLRWGANSWEFTRAGEWWRLVTGGFLHGGLLHLAVNMYSLYNVGRSVERFYGHARFALIYGVSLVTGSLAGLYWNHAMVEVGASGAIFGVCGALFVFLMWRARETNHPGVRTAMYSVGRVLVLNLIIGQMIPHVSNAGHIGGLVGGMVVGWAAMSRTAVSEWGAMIRGVVAGAAVLSAGFLIGPKLRGLPAEPGPTRELIVDALRADRALEEAMNTEVGEVFGGALQPVTLASLIDGRILPGCRDTIAEIQTGLAVPGTVEAEVGQAAVKVLVARVEILQKISIACRTAGNGPAGLSSIDSRMPEIDAMQESAQKLRHDLFVKLGVQDP